MVLDIENSLTKEASFAISLNAMSYFLRNYKEYMLE